MKYDIQFRKAEQKDVKKIIEIQNICFYDDYVTYGECPAYNEKEDEMAKYIEENIAYVIEANGQPIGDILIHRKSDTAYHITVICLLPDYHNKGIGQTAMNFIESDNPEAKVWTLVTPSRSFRNHHFYEKMGYEKIAEHRQSDSFKMFEFRKIIE